MPESLPSLSARDGVTIVTFGPEYKNLDQSILEELERFLLETADRTEPPLLVIDLGQTQFFGSAFIEVLFRLWKRLTKRNGRFVLCGLQPYCAEVIGVTHLDRIWPIADDQDAAVTLLKSQPQESAS